MHTIGKRKWRYWWTVWWTVWLFDCALDPDTFSLKAFMITITRKDSQMSCWCNKSGRCTNCVCVKSSKKCSSCLPKRLGNCRNQVGTSFGPTKSVPCPTDVDSQSQAERVTAEIRLLMGLPQQQPAETPPKVTTEENHNYLHPTYYLPSSLSNRSILLGEIERPKKYQPPSTTSMMR